MEPDAREIDRRVAVAVVVIAGLLVHGQVLAVGYLADDYDLIEAAASPTYGLLDAFPAGRGTYFRPVVMASLRLERLLFPGASPLVHHATNLALHVASALLVHAVAETLFGARRRALLAALVFLVHPLVVTNVAWISGRTDSLAALFFLAALLAFARVLRGGSARWAAATVACAALALLAKEMAVSLALVLGALWAFDGGAANRKLARATLASVVVLTALYLVALRVRFYGPDAPIPSTSPRVLLRGMVSLPVTLLCPNSSSSLRRFAATHPASLVAAGAVVAAAVALATRWALGARAIRRRLVALLVLSASPLLVLFVTGLNVSSRLAYVPLAVLCVAACAVVELAPGAARPLGIAAGLALAPMAVGSAAHGRTWVESSRRTEAYCQDLKRVDDGTRPIVFVTVPSERANAPLWREHHLVSAVHHCLRGTFGQVEAWPIAPVQIEGAIDEPAVVVERASVAEIAVRSTRPDVVFRFQPPLDREATLEGMTLTPTGAAPTGDALSFRLKLPEDRAASLQLVYFDGLRVLRVAAPRE